MGRLIDADALIKEIKHCRGTGYHQQGYYTATQDIIDIIEQQNTSYDVNKVVEQLEELMLPNEWQYVLDCAIDIVKKGGR